MKTYWCMGWFGLLFIVAAMACTTTAPALDLIKPDDHRGLAVWYDHEAARLQGNAEEMLQMAAEYAKSSYQLSVIEQFLSRSAAGRSLAAFIEPLMASLPAA